MSKEPADKSASATSLRSGQVDDVCRRFEAAWRTNPRPKIEEYVDLESSSEDSHRVRELLIEIVGIDLECRWGTPPGDPAEETKSTTSRLSCRPRLADYVARYPTLGPLRELPAELICHEYCVRHVCGDGPEHDEYMAIFGKRYPNLRDMLLQEDRELAEEAVSPNAMHNSPMAAGSRVGPYKILEALGEGGFGTVYLAEQESPMKRRVALKVVKAGMDTKQVLARFEAERQALAMMNHPNIARVFDAGVTDTGHPYFVMELVEGEWVTAYCDGQRFTVDQRLDLFIQICEAIQHAHQRGVIHRDIKPSNVLVTVQDDRPAPKVIDFGVAKAMAKSLTEESLVTEQGLLIGTPAYMSPEQAQRSGLDVDTRSDVYSLGVLLYELLTGALPFDAQSLQEAGFSEIPRILREVEPPVPSKKVSTLADQSDTVAQRRWTSPEGLRRRLQGELDWIVMKALEKDRDQRYSTPVDFARDVQRYIDHEPVEAAPPRLVYRMRKLVRRHRLPLGIAALVVLLLVAGITTSTYFALQSYDNAQQAQSLLGVANSQKDRADEERDNARRETQAAKAAREHAERQNYYTTIRLVTAKLDAGQYGGVHEALLECPQELRGWEWGHLMDRCPKENWKMPAHEGRVNTLAVSPDGDSFLSGGVDGRLILWDVIPSSDEKNASNASSESVDGSSETNEPAPDNWAAVQSVTPRWMVTAPLRILDVAFFPDGGQVAALTSGQFFVLDAKKGDVRHESLPARAKCFCLSSDGQWLYIGTEETDTQPPSIEQYRTSDWELSRTHELESAPRSIAVDNQGDYVAVVDDGDRFSVYETSDWECSWEGTTGRFPSNVWVDSGTGRLVITAWEYVRIHDSWQNTSGCSYTHDLPVTSLDVDLNRGVLVTGGQDGVAKLNRLEDGESLGTIEQGPSISAVQLPSGGGVLTGDVQGTVRYWAGFDQSTDVRRRSLDGELGAGSRVSFRSDGKLLAVHGWPQKHPILWNTQTWEMKKHEIPEMNEWVCLFRPSTNELTAGVGDTIRFYETSGLEIEEVRAIETQGKARFGCFSDDGRLLGVSFLGGGIELFDLDTSREFLLEPNLEGGCVVAITRDGARFAARECQSGNTYVWDTKTGSRVQSFKMPVLELWDPRIAIHPDGDVLATSDGATIFLWSIEHGEVVRELKGHSNALGVLEFSPDGDRLLSGGADQTIRVWDWRLGRELLKLSNGSYSVLSATFSPCGRWIASTDSGPDARVSSALPWDTDDHIRTFPGLSEAQANSEAPSLETMTDSLGIELVRIPPGEFEMGSTQDTIDRFLDIGKKHEGAWFADLFTNEGPKHHVRITRPFYMGKHEVTVGQFGDFVEATGYETEAEKAAERPAHEGERSDDRDQNGVQLTWRRSGFVQADDHPVVLVTWNDAAAFCEWLTQVEGQEYRLPTEAEWEYACRAGEFPWDHIVADNHEPLGLREWYGHNSGRQPHAVGQKFPNRWGLCDMRGNVAEWCHDWFAANYYDLSPTDDPAGVEAGDRHTVRGGNYGTRYVCRAAFRNGVPPNRKFPWFGFRVVRQADPASQRVSAPSDN